jgi:endonuclease I
MKRIILTMLVLCAHVAAYSQTVLSPGDVAIIGYNYDNPDVVKFVPLVDIAAGTVLKFTDNGWNGTSLTSTEGTDTWTATNAVLKGTVQTINAVSMAFSTSGDQIFIYQGAATSPSFIFGLTTKPWVTGTITSTTSRKPSSLGTGISCVAFSTERDNGRYQTVSSTGTKEVIQGQICSTSNWSLTDTRISTFPTWLIAVSGFSNEPASNPTAVTFSNIKSYCFTASFAPVAADGYLIVRNTAIASITPPADGITYQRGDAIGNTRVLSVGLATSFLVEGTTANEYNEVLVYAYNGSGATINYQQLNPAFGQVITHATEEGTYYMNLNEQSNSFVVDLQNRIRSPYTKITYDQYDETMMTHFAVGDAAGNQRFATCAYSGQVYAYSAPFAWYTATPFSREHTWCVSWTPTNATSGTNEYCDQHHLFPVNQNSANAVRSNHPLGEVSTLISSYLEGKYGYDVAGNLVYEPKDSHKGDAARALLYMSLRYNGINGADWTFDYLNNVTLLNLGEDEQDISLLLTWHAQDAPDGYEIARNDYVASLQGNRNPFIDHPEWANRILFNNLSYIPVPSQAPPSFDHNLHVQKQLEADVYPNPTKDNGYIHIQNRTHENGFVVVMDMQGRQIFQQTLNTPYENQLVEVGTQQWPSGLYFVQIQAGGESVLVKWLVE